METSKKYPESRAENFELAYSHLGNSLRYLSGSVAENPTWIFLQEINKPDRATMRPDYVSACIDHVTYIERQMDKQTGETTQNMLLDHLFQ